MSIEMHKSGFEELAELIKSYELTEEKKINALEAGAKALVSDVRRLPKPMSKIRAPGYTHLLYTVTCKRAKKEIEVGWGKYYGPMVENGAKTMKGRGTPHIYPTFQKNRKKYYGIVEGQLFGQGG